jgi:hypothetical protein
LPPAFGANARRLLPPPHGFFTPLPKEFGSLVRVQGDIVEVVLDRTGERLTRRLVPGADVFHHGGPGTLADFAPGDRLWVVMEGDAKRNKRADIRLLADEISVQEIHTEWSVLKAVDLRSGMITLAPPAAAGTKEPVPPLRLRVLPAARIWLGSAAAAVTDLRPGISVRIQTRHEASGYAIALIADAAGFAALQADQRRTLDRQLAHEGLPGSAAAGLIAGDWEVVVDRTGSPWARALSAGDAIRLAHADATKARPIPATVRSIHPWGERTLVVLTPDVPAPPPPAARPARVRLLTPPPRTGVLPPGLGRAQATPERIDWILSTIYCTCSNSNDVCTGQLYTLFLCKTTACPMPKVMRGKLAAWIAAGKTDAEILHLIEQEQGPRCRKMHLIK